MRLTTTLNAAETGHQLVDAYDEETRRHEACVLLNEYTSRGCPKSGSSCSGYERPHPRACCQQRVRTVLGTNEYTFADMAIEGPGSGWSSGLAVALVPCFSPMRSLMISLRPRRWSSAWTSPPSCRVGGRNSTPTLATTGRWCANAGDSLGCGIVATRKPKAVVSPMPSDARADMLGHLLLYHFDDGSVIKHVSLSAQSPY